MPSTESISFLHLADLHLYPCPRGGRCGPSDPACHSCIKASILDELARRVAASSKGPQLLLLAGDLTDSCNSEEQLARTTAPLQRLLDAATSRGWSLAGVTGEHDGADGTQRLRSTLGWDWLLRSSETARCGHVVVYGVEGRPNREGFKRDIKAIRIDKDHRSVLLAHGDYSELPRSSAFDYVALGHLHRGKLICPSKGDGPITGYPGQLFSYWDGCGKAWPVYGIEGTIASDGTVRAQLVPLSPLTGAPETRRAFIDFKYSGKPSGFIVLENAPDASALVSKGLVGTVREDVDPKFGNVFRRTAELPYRSQGELRSVLRTLVEDYPDDVFVSPSTGGGWRDRLTDYGRNIVARRFEEFVTKSYKRSEITQ